MSSFDAVVICLSIAAISLIIVSLVNRSQTRRRLVTQKLELMKRRINELEEISVMVEPLIESKFILVYVLNELVDLINKTRKLDPESHYLEANLADAEERQDQIHAGRSSSKLWRILTSDAQIARARYALNETGRILRKRQTLGELEPTELQKHISELAWAHLMVGVITLVGQGHQAVNRGDVLKAYAFYKNAQQALMRSTHPDSRRHRFIRELSEVLANNRKAISSDIMPEADYNPGAHSDKLVMPEQDQQAQA